MLFRSEVLHVRFVTTVALYITVDQVNFVQGIGGSLRRRQTRDQIRRIFQRFVEAERMRRLQIAPEHIVLEHGPGHSHGSIRHELSHRDRSVVTAETKTGGSARNRLPWRILDRRTGVCRICLCRERLSPEWGAASNAGMGRMTI